MISIAGEQGTAQELAAKREDSAEWQAKIAARIAELAASTEAWIDVEMAKEREVRRAEWREQRHEQIRTEVLGG
jgi:low affinity Fe/Cu permease